MSTCPVFREINPADMQAIFDVRVATWHNDNGHEELIRLGINHASVQEMLKRTHRGWLCEIGSKVIGFAMGDRSNGEMWVIAVVKEHEGKGIGRRLLKLVEDWLFDEGWDDIWLTTDPDEDFRAVGFYRHLGWADWKIDPDGDRFMRKKKQEVG
ncbi:MAG: GNAT family N-acetyltransferase [Planctomycetota bacterium]